MIKIAITAAAYDAIARTLPLGSVGYEAEANERGKRLIWFEAALVDQDRSNAGAGRELLRRDPAVGGDGRLIDAPKSDQSARGRRPLAGIRALRRPPSKRRSLGHG
jgi:hypothetical protein